MLQDGTEVKYSDPRALSIDEIQKMVNIYRQAALNAIRAGYFFSRMHIKSLVVLNGTLLVSSKEA